jgi:glutamate N-acetyltransferase/amino-acid N-acetyltransferase
VALQQVCVDLSKQIARDGEGATRMFTVAIVGAAGESDARNLARTVAGSNLVKTAIHGGDPNWGRIVAALGRAGAELVLDKLTVTVGAVVVFHHGAGIPEVDLDQVRQAFESDEVSITCELGLGDGAATAYGCDLSAEYVHINADYTT